MKELENNFTVLGSRGYKDPEVLKKLDSKSRYIFNVENFL